MYAVFTDGSRQYRVSEGDLVRLDWREAEIGSRLELGNVLLYQAGQDTRIGQPTIKGARILAEVTDHTSVKVTIQKFRRRKNYRRFNGHRQHYVMVQIHNILLPGQEAPAPKPTPTKESAPASSEKSAE